MEYYPGSSRFNTEMDLVPHLQRRHLPDLREQRVPHRPVFRCISGRRGAACPAVVSMPVGSNNGKKVLAVLLQFVRAHSADL